MRQVPPQKRAFTAAAATPSGPAADHPAPSGPGAGHPAPSVGMPPPRQVPAAASPLSGFPGYRTRAPQKPMKIPAPKRASEVHRVQLIELPDGAKGIRVSILDAIQIAPLIGFTERIVQPHRWVVWYT